MPTTAKIRCRRRSHLAGALSFIVALILQAFCWGFTVDDAWIVSRVAAHGASGGAFAFNSSGPLTDAVTPLGYAQFLAGLGALGGYKNALDLWWAGTLARPRRLRGLFLPGRVGHCTSARGRWLVVGRVAAGDCSSFRGMGGGGFEWASRRPSLDRWRPAY